MFRLIEDVASIEILRKEESPRASMKGTSAEVTLPLAKVASTGKDSDGSEETKTGGLKFQTIEEEYALAVEDEEEIFLDAQEEIILVSPDEQVATEQSSFVC